MHHYLKMYFHVNPKKSKVHRNECLRLLMKIIRIKVKIVKENLDLIKEQGQKKSFGPYFLTNMLEGET